MKKQKNPPSSSHKGGYKKKPVLIKTDKPTVKEVKTFVPVPSGIKEVLNAKIHLSKYIAQETKYFTVSINVQDGKWILEVRGVNPFISEWNGYEVKYIPNCIFVRHPKAKGM